MESTLGMFLVREMNCLVGTGRDADAVEITLGFVHGSYTTYDGERVPGAGKNTGTGTTAFFLINDDLGHTETFLERRLLSVEA